jgi:oxygen-independent coproporphyrinogen-3 oxidase
MRLIKEHAEIAPDAEVSIEANPDGLNEEKLAALRTAGWNRLSLGAQSFDNDALKFLGRTHTAAQIEAVFFAARHAGFENISLDFIFAVPGQSRESWRATVRHAGELQPEHVSCYSLTIEDGTPFARRVEKGRLDPVGDESQADLMQDTEEILSDANLRRYEVSNYARPGWECRHNLNYWRGGDYLACGCGAHGHANGHRWWNERAAPRYVSLMREAGSARVGEEVLQPRQRLAERIMLGLRLGEGFPLDQVSRELAPEVRYELDEELQNLLSRGILLERGGVIRLAAESMVVADAVASRLMPS